MSLIVGHGFDLHSNWWNSKSLPVHCIATSMTKQPLFLIQKKTNKTHTQTHTKTSLQHLLLVHCSTFGACDQPIGLYKIWKLKHIPNTPKHLIEQGPFLLQMWSQIIRNNFCFTDEGHCCWNISMDLAVTSEMNENLELSWSFWTVKENT